MIYEVGKQYEMRVVDIRVDSAGYNYIALHDDDPNKEYRVYNILKCQYESLPDTIYVKVKSIDAFGKIKFVQDEGRLNKEHYQEGKLYAFEVTDVKEDYRTKDTYYVIEDDFSSHRLYFKDEQKYKIGDSCIFEVTGFTEKGSLKLKEAKSSNKKNVEKPIDTNKDNTANKLTALWDKLPILDVGDESQTLELKTSISFPPGQSDPDIRKQLYNILRELTAFMNTDGGTLYIGIHDKTKKVVGIAADFQHLNDDSDDEYNGTYANNKDGYELKIRNTIDKLCPTMANSLTTINFETINDIDYCVITVKPAKRPIFLDGTKLYVRQGNRVKLLRGEDITSFIYERMTISIREVLDTDGIQMNPNTLDIDVLKQVMRSLINERKAIPRDLPKPKDLGEIDYWFVWYQDGTWKKIRNKPEEKNVYTQVPIYKNLNASILAFCYETKVSTVKLDIFKKGANMNKLQTKNWWSRTGEQPKNIFVMDPTDFLVGYIIDCNGIEYVKLHAISDYTPATTAGAQGGPFAPENARVETYAVLGAEHKKKIEHLISTKAKRSSDLGTPLSSPTHKDEIEYLEKVLKHE
jgi:hypothetical protein